MIANVFNTPRLCAVTGNIQSHSLLAQTPRQAMLNGRSPDECKAFVLSQAYNGINVTTQAASDESRRKAGRRINHI